LGFTKVGGVDIFGKTFQKLSKNFPKNFPKTFQKLSKKLSKNFPKTFQKLSKNFGLFG
jgi:hypothetical protein